MDRRDALRQVLWAGAAAALAPLTSSCAPGHPELVARPGSGAITVDESFARLALQCVERDDAGVRAQLLGHPALAAVLRHRRLAGDREDTGEALLARLLASARRTRHGARVLDAWAGRGRELAGYVEAAGRYLPAGAAFAGTVFLVVGYDIGVAAPPDIVLNVGHEHFQAAPAELGFYATHEAHHVGFFALRPPPALEGLDDPRRLHEIIRYFAQLEGMAVHAAYVPRRERGSLEADPDYRVYLDETEARRVTARYAAQAGSLAREGPLSDAEVGGILEAMSSGERLWYRFGALAARQLERTRGREALIESMADPSAFERAAAVLLQTASSSIR